MKKSPVLLCILDGWGLSDRPEFDATAVADTPNVDQLLRANSATLTTFGTDVGLPKGQMGNSEVGHMNIGAGRIVEMDLRRIESAIENNSLKDKPAIQKLCQVEGQVHLLCVLSDGGVHAHLDHMIEIAKILHDAGREVQLHLMTDGRDVAQKSADRFLKHLDQALGTLANVATVSGRYYAMDRDKRWERVETAYRAIMFGQGVKADSASEVVNQAYQNDITDEFIKPTVIGDYSGIADGDALMILNFRADRARQIMSAIGDPNFDAFDIGKRAKLSLIVGMAEYSDDHNVFIETVFPNEDIKNGLGEWVAACGKTQFRIAETEKYPHVTFFFNGGIEKPNEGEDRYLAPSPKVATYDLQPEMSEREVSDNLVAAIEANKYDLLIVNYANPDMVGHTGDLDAAAKACAAVDTGLGKVLSALEQVDGKALIIADHGNCEVMVDPETGEPHTAHTTNPVPVALVGLTNELRKDGILADVAPTVLEMMGLDQPTDMTGKSLLT